jgi:3-deoxy-D-manno-octulosonic-acid transferase
MGLWYRLGAAALVGGSFGGTGGHNPWEPARLGAAVLHGPNVANFRGDYARFHEAGAARQVGDATALAAALTDPALPDIAARGRALADEGMAGLDRLTDSLLALLTEGKR